MYQLCKTFASIWQQIGNNLQQNRIAYFKQVWLYDAYCLDTIKLNCSNKQCNFVADSLTD